MNQQQYQQQFRNRKVHPGSQSHPGPPPVSYPNPMYEPNAQDVQGAQSAQSVKSEHGRQSRGFWEKARKPWWPRARTGVLVGAGVLSTGVILCACHIPIGGLLIAAGIVIIIGSVIYAIVTDVE